MKRRRIESRTSESAIDSLQPVEDYKFELGDWVVTTRYRRTWSKHKVKKGTRAEIVRLPMEPEQPWYMIRVLDDPAMPLIPMVPWELSRWEG